MERRQLTIMFTDLVNSTGLADCMDPEDFRALIEAHRTVAVAPIMRYGGVVARYLGDGMLVLFGYPEAHEDSPDRAVRAGLEVVEATKKMNARWVGEGRGRIAVRIGIHTGIVVVGDVLKADVQEMMAVFGNAPSISARLQALATANSVVLSGSTKNLLPPSVRCETRGNTILKGMSRPVEIFTAVEVREGGERRPAGRVLPFVNREGELAQIRRAWAAVRKGEGQHLQIEGEAGIGKSRLVRAVRERIVTQPSRWLMTRTSPYATNTDFFVFFELFQQILRGDDSRDDDAETPFDRLKRTLSEQGHGSQDIAIGFANLLGITIPEEATSSPLQPDRARELTLAAITAWLRHEAEKHPLVLAIEDLHWADASSLETIDRLKQTLQKTPTLLLTTTRSAGAAGTSLTGGAVDTSSIGDATPAQPGDAVPPQTPRAKAETTAGEARTVMPAQASPAGAAGTLVYLERLRPGYAEDLLEHVLQGVDLPKAAVTTLLERANGVPLYLEELPKPVLEGGGSTGGAPITLPATLRDSLMAQLDRMGEAKMVAQTAAVLGDGFERPLLEHVWEGDRQSLETGLTTLTDASLIMQDSESATCGFRHALLAEIAYDSLLRDDRRRIHQKTADALVDYFQSLSEGRPELIARHHEAAGNHEEAFQCWLTAGNAAAKRSANAEALGHLKNAEAMLAEMQYEGLVELEANWLALYLARGPALIALHGWSAVEVEKTYQAAFRLAESLQIQNRDLFDAWRGLLNVYLLRGDLSEAEKAAVRLSEMVESLKDGDLRLSWHRSAGLCDFLAARFDNAIHHMEAPRRTDDPVQQARDLAAQGTVPSVIACSIMSWSHCLRGEEEAADQALSEALDTAKRVEHPFSQCYALCLGSSVAQSQNRPKLSLGRADEAITLSIEHGFAYWKAWGTIVKGWSIAELGNTGEGIQLLEDGIEQYKATDAAQMLGYSLSLLAEAWLCAGRFDDARSTAEAALREMDRTGIVFYQPEACRLLAEACCRRDGLRSRSLAYFNKALRLSERQASLPLFCRAHHSLLTFGSTDRLERSVVTRGRAMLRRVEASGSPAALAVARKNLGAE